MNDFSALQELGLYDSEVTVFLECLKKEGSTVKEIAQRTGIIRTTVYSILDSLMSKGLVSKTQRKGEKTFQALQPQDLLNLMEQKRDRLALIIPELNKLTMMQQPARNVEFYEGRRAIEVVHNDIIAKPNEDIRILGGGQKWLEFSQPYISIYYRKKKENKVFSRTLLSDVPSEKAFAKSDKATNSEVRTLPGTAFIDSSTFIYHDKVGFVNYTDPHGVIVQDVEFSNVMRQIFDQLWQKSHKTDK
ncbi:MAG: helix-turn-helix domain-containing protein [archaeon]